MTLKKQLNRHLGKKATKRVYASAPWVGGALALAAGVIFQRRGARGLMDDVRHMLSARGPSADAASSVNRYDDDLVGSR